MVDSRKLKVDNGIKHILLYALAIATFIFILKWIQWKFLIVENAIHIYVGLIAILFTILGMWFTTQLLKPKTQTVFVEKHIIIQEPENFCLNQTALKKLNLTNREYQVLTLIVKGLSNAEVANELFLSLSTIKSHASSLYVKMNVKNRYQAMIKAKKMNIVK